jgi:hypothetical protein
MTNYARQCKSTVIPGLYYRNAKLMIEWLCDTFGFVGPRQINNFFVS